MAKRCDVQVMWSIPIARVARLWCARRGVLTALSSYEGAKTCQAVCRPQSWMLLPSSAGCMRRCGGLASACLIAVVLYGALQRLLLLVTAFYEWSGECSVRIGKVDCGSGRWCWDDGARGVGCFGCGAAAG